MKNFIYTSVVAVKIIVRRSNTILILREPETNTWMPGRLALPGGKLLLSESIEQAIERKIRTEIGFKVNVVGLIKIFDILMPDKNVYHFIIFADYQSGEIDTTKTESKELMWMDSTMLKNLSKDDFAEWYNDQLLDEVLQEKFTVIPLSLISTQDNKQQAILNWMR